MGRFSTTVQIKNNTDRAGFISAFNDVMAKRGFVPCAEDEAAKSYLLAFSEGWVTVASDSYTDNPATTQDDTQRFANEMKTSAFIVEVVDSDFAILMLYGEKTDEVIVGDGSGYGIEDAPKGNRECWEHLLAEDKTWEKISEIWGKDEVFVEDVLWKSAPVLGINPEFMCADFRDFSEKGENSENDQNITAFYFKKAGTNGKPMTLNAAFVKVFGEALEPLGFSKIKSKYPYFVRVVPGGEIIHIITYRTEDPDRMDEKSFNILGGVATVYVDDIDLTKNPLVENINWLESNAMLYRKTTEEYDEDFFSNIWKFSFKKDDEDSMLRELWHSLDITNKIIMPAISKAINIDTCIHYLTQTNRIAGFDERGEGLLYLKTGNYIHILEDDINELFEKRCEELQEEGYTQEKYDDLCQKFECIKRRELAPIEKILTTPELCMKYADELERRKAMNVEKFRSYGLDI